MGGIWQGGDHMSLFDSIIYSLTGMATVFMILVCLALAIIVISKILDSMGLGVNSAKKTTNAQTTQKVTTEPTAPRAVEENMEEYAVILASVSEHTRIPIERLKINSITKR